MTQQNLGKIIILVGAALMLIGLIYYFAGDKLNWIGRLPGDIKIEGEGTKIYFPITTMILLSLLFTGLMRLIQYLK